MILEKQKRVDVFLEEPDKMKEINHYSSVSCVGRVPGRKGEVVRVQKGDTNGRHALRNAECCEKGEHNCVRKEKTEKGGSS